MPANSLKGYTLTISQFTCSLCKRVVTNQSNWETAANQEIPYGEEGEAKFECPKCGEVCGNCLEDHHCRKCGSPVSILIFSQSQADWLQVSCANGHAG